MPVLDFEKVVECSSEDSEFCAKNLLRKDLIKSWKTANVGESQAHVILQLKSPSVINSIEIGGESTAFIEVLVRRSSDDSSQFEVLLSPCSFMTPSESKSLSNLNRVRCFDKSKLCPSSVDQSWDQIKVICCQPFNKTIKYGVAFIKINSPSNEDEDVEETSLSSLKLGAFKVKASTSSDGESSAVGSWFAKRHNTPTTSDNSQLVLRNKEVKKPSLAVAAGVTPKRQKKDTPKATVKSPNNEKTNTSNNVPTSTHKTRKVATKNVPFNRLMSKVVFVISGIQNPERAELRAKGLEMGAKYKPDWDATCTHLICAFVNTPKYNQVITAKGRIVKKHWINDCHTQRKLLPWRDYKLGNYTIDSSPDESEEEPQATSSSYLVETDDEEAQQSENSPMSTSVKSIDEKITPTRNNTGNHASDERIYEVETESDSEDRKPKSS